jgi:hypothetical protein
MKINLAGIGDSYEINKLYQITQIHKKISAEKVRLGAKKKIKKLSS